MEVSTEKWDVGQASVSRRMHSQLSTDTAVEPVIGTRIPTYVLTQFEQVAQYVADNVAALIELNTRCRKPTVLGLPTGSTPVGVYRELIRRHREEGLDFSRVVTFNLDEYYPMDPASIHSYRRWMHENFFDHVNLKEENIHIPRGDLSRTEAEQFCRDYERNISDAGGIDLILLGIGRTGHIGFNEPGSPPDSRTRMVDSGSGHSQGRRQQFLLRGTCPAQGDHNGSQHDP